MSIQYINSQIDSLNRDINSLTSQIQTIDGNINSKQKDANRIVENIHREKDLRRMMNYQNDLTRKNDDIHRLEKDRLNKAKTLSDKQKRKGDLQLQLINEEKREREKVKREHQEILSLQQQINREMQQQRFASLQTISSLPAVFSPKNYDVFVSHASEDKDDFVRPFVDALVQRGLKVWYDESVLRVGDSLRRTIENGLRNSKYGIVVLSEAFFKKEWPQRELDGLFAREVEGEKVILPIWHKISKNEVMRYSPIVADMLALNTSNFTVEEIAIEIAQRVLGDQ